MKSTDVDRIKRLALIAMVSDDALMERLILKGGNAIQIAYNIDSRASKDLDFSMQEEFTAEELTEVEDVIRTLLLDTFREAGYHVFDVKMEEKPENISEDLRGYWGGYRVEFKVIDLSRKEALKSELESLRRNAIKFGEKGKFYIDISKFEYCRERRSADVDGYTVYVYSPEMIVFEKLRAICQQMPKYASQVRDPGATARARDFYDIFLVSEKFGIDFRSGENKTLMRSIFRAKRVDVSLLRDVSLWREYHRPDFEAVKKTVSPTTNLKTFDFYFEYVTARILELEPLGDE